MFTRVALCLGLSLVACAGKSAPPAAPAPSNDVVDPAPGAPPAPPDPIDGVAGTLSFPAALAATVPAGATVFLVARAADAEGKAVGMPLAVAKLTYDGAPIAFQLTSKDSLIDGAEPLSGEVVILARYDQDADARTKQPGDIIGQIRATVPAAGLALVLDDVLR